MKEFIIERSKWIRGESGNKSQLLCEDGRMCCLGFISNQSGVPKKHLLDKPFPHDVPEDYYKKIRFLLSEGGYDNKLTDKAVDINDDASLDDKEREKQLKALFKKHDIKLRFVK